MAAAEVALGSTGRALGNLAASLCRHDEAARHLQHTAEADRRALPWAAHGLHDHARMPPATRRQGNGDKLRARRLLDEAYRLYEPAGCRHRQREPQLTAQRSWHGDAAVRYPRLRSFDTVAP